MNDDRIGFAIILAESGPHGFLGMNECEKYGMAWGCVKTAPYISVESVKMKIHWRN